MRTVINDPIHGHFELPAHALQFIDTPHIQRLRDLKQLGGTYLVYPGASQNRFEHSVGVSHLSATFVRGLYSSPRARHACSAFEGASHFRDSLRLVRIAGLCHDLGHGPFVRHNPRTRVLPTPRSDRNNTEPYVRSQFPICC